jgi:predicted nucleotidyltransferase
MQRIFQTDGRSWAGRGNRDGKGKVLQAQRLTLLELTARHLLEPLNCFHPNKKFITNGSKIIHMVQNRDNLDAEIILLLLRGENHLRGIAKELNESHSTVLRKLNKLVEENILDYRMVGRNKTFLIKKNLQARNYVFNAERYKLLKLIKRYPELSVIIEDILRKTNERLIVLFGSYSKFTAKKDSDIDLYVETRNRKIKEEIESLHSKIKVKIGDFDLSSALIKEIIKSHVILKGVEEFYEKIKFFE